MKLNKGKVGNCFLILSLLLFSMAVAAIAQDDEIRLIVRGDDMGMTQGSLMAFERVFNHGVLTSGAVQVVGPWFEGAVELCKRNPGWCVGVHLALIGEWQGYRWRPVLPWDQVPSLVDEDGFLFRYPDELLANNPDPKEMEAELRAQVELALKKGLNVQYLDVHYGGLNREIIRKIAEDYDLPVSGQFGAKRIGSIYSVPVDKKIETAVKFLEAAEPGLYIWVVHPGVDTPEQNALIHTLPEHIFMGGGVGKHRAAETEAVTSIEVKSMIMKKKIKLVSFNDLWEEQKKR